jgi:molybdopterin-guanine dinucleotide biosynthesis protein A
MTKQDVGGIVLCGGKSSRFGSPKGSYKFRSKEMIRYSVELLREFTQDIIIVGPKIINDKDVVFVNDIFENSGPLAGIHAGLMHTKFQKNVVLACDLPFLNNKTISVLLELANKSDIVIYQTNDQKIHPLTGIYDKTLLPKIEDCLTHGKNKMIDFIYQQEHKVIELKDDNDTDHFTNFNFLNDAQRFE